MFVSPEDVSESAIRHGFKKKGKSNFVKDYAEVLQLVNLQRSSFSNDYYRNFAVCPKAMQMPERIAEHLFPLRGRIKSVLEATSAADAEVDTFF